MFTKLSSRPSPSVSYRCKRLEGKTNEPSVTDRQEKVAGFSQQALTAARIILIGGGGLGGEIGEALVRKGIGELCILDPDIVEPTNLNRQRFYETDLYKNKAKCLARNLAKEGFCGTLIQGYGLSFEEACKRGIDLLGSVAIVGVDNNPTRIAACGLYRKEGLPVIFTAVSRQADHGYVFIQEPGQACFACLFPRAVNDDTYPCPGTPAVKDILKVMGGIVSYAVDTLTMKRLRVWNYKSIFLDGTIPGSDSLIEARQDCKLCHSDQPRL
jgi:molybdopterin/thiamine biosynthesis adenylyltransferase